MKNQKNVVVKKESHSRKSVSGIYNARCCQIKDNSLLNECVEAPRVLRTAKSGMTTNFNQVEALNKGSFRAPLRSGFTARSVTPQCWYAGYSGHSGFTLIELLVVVLIIGILAAVALPQYKKAVVKSQFIQLQLAATTYWKAINAYYLANGDWPSSLNELDVSMNTNSSYKCTFFIHRTDTADSVRCNLTKYPTLIYGFILRSNPSSSYGYCEASKTSPLENKLCTSIEGAWLSGGNTARNTYSFKLQ